MKSFWERVKDTLKQKASSLGEKVNEYSQYSTLSVVKYNLTKQAERLMTDLGGKAYTLFSEKRIDDLRDERVFLSIELDLPGDKKPVRAHAVAAWVKPLDAGGKGGKGKCLLGLRFKEITRLDKDRVLGYVFTKTA